MITVIDYGRGNLFSLAQALTHIGAAHRITSDPQILQASERIIFPGVGAFGDAAAGLRSRSLEAPLLDAALRGVPILGICVGCQLLLEQGEEFGRHKGLGLLRGTVRRLPEPANGDLAAIRIPNVGWRRLDTRPGDPLLSPLHGKMVYFVHSFAPMVEDPADAVAHITVNGQHTPVAVRRGAVAGVQFHPEKSATVGLALLKRFAEWSPES
jgi:glutamine amidotransferase